MTRSRDIRLFEPTGEEVPNDLLAGIIDVRRNILRKNEEKEPGLKEFLEQIDFDSLCGVIKEITSRCGIEAEEVNLVDQENIFNSKELGGEERKKMASYDPRLNTISLEYKVIEAYAKEFGLSKNLVLLGSLCHELIHSAGKFDKIMHLPDEEKAKVLRVLNTIVGVLRIFVGGKRGVGIEGDSSVSGYRYDDNLPLEGEISGFELKKEVFIMFDEGVVEKLAREVFLEYLRRNPGIASDAEISKYVESWKSEKMAARFSEVRFIEEFIQALVKKTGLDYDTVWGGIAQGEFSGINFQNQELRKQMAELFDEKFLEELALAKTKGDLESITKKYLR